MTNSIQMGRTYTIVPPTDDPGCIAPDCELHNASLLNPWLAYAGKRVTVVETGLEHAAHDAVRITTGPVDWHPQVAVRLTDDQVQALGVSPGTAPTTYLMLGYVWAVDTDAAPAYTDLDLDSGMPWAFMSQVEMPQQRTEIIPVACLQDGSPTPEDKRREDRLRRIARAQGLRLRKLRGYLDPGVPGPYLLEDPGTRAPVAGSRWDRRGLSLGDIETALTARKTDE